MATPSARPGVLELAAPESPAHESSEVQGRQQQSSSQAALKLSFRRASHSLGLSRVLQVASSAHRVIVPVRPLQQTMQHSQVPLHLCGQAIVASQGREQWESQTASTYEGLHLQITLRTSRVPTTPTATPTSTRPPACMAEEFIRQRRGQVGTEVAMQGNLLYIQLRAV